MPVSARWRAMSFALAPALAAFDVVADFLAVQPDGAALEFLQHVDAAEQVVLPEPDEPMMEMTSPSRTAQSTP